MPDVLHTVVWSLAKATSIATGSMPYRIPLFMRRSADRRCRSRATGIDFRSTRVPPRSLLSSRARLQAHAQAPRCRARHAIGPLCAASPTSGSSSLLDSGDKIILPPDALQQLTLINVRWPVLFAVSAARKHCVAEGDPATMQASPQSLCAGVLEFTADADCVHLPRWMMQQLKLESGDWVRLGSLPEEALLKGSWCQLRPKNTGDNVQAFLDATNHQGARPLLEAALTITARSPQALRLRFAHRKAVAALL